MNGTFIIALGAGRVEVLCAPECGSLLDGAQRHLRKLGGNYFDGRLRHRCPFAHHLVGQHGQQWQENVITVAFMTVAAAIVVCAVFVLRGARRT